MRRKSVTPASIACIAVAVCVGVLMAHPGGIRAAVQDLREYGALQERLKSDAEFNLLLQAQTVAVNNRIQIKDALIDELILGHTTLEEVTARFKVLNYETPSTMTILEIRYPHLTDEERTAQNVIDFVVLRELSGSDHQNVMKRLQAEYQQQFGPRSFIIH